MLLIVTADFKLHHVADSIKFWQRVGIEFFEVLVEIFFIVFQRYVCIISTVEIIKARVIIHPRH